MTTAARGGLSRPPKGTTLTNLPRLLAAAALLALVAGCKTTAKSPDTTPPELVFRYRVNDGMWAEIPSGGASVTVGKTDTLQLWANAHDTGGVYLVQIDAKGSKQCVTEAGMIAVSSTSFSAENRAPAGTEPGDSTLATLFALLTIDMDEDLCTNALSRASLSCTSLAMNFDEEFRGTAASGTLEVTVE